MLQTYCGCWNIEDWNISSVTNMIEMFWGRCPLPRQPQEDPCRFLVQPELDLRLGDF